MAAGTQAPPSPPPPASTPMPRVRRRRRFGSRTVIGGLAILAVIYLVAGPLLMLVLTSFQDTSLGLVIRPPFPWSLQNYVDVFGDSGTYSAILSTLIFSAGSLLVAFAVSITCAWLVERTDLPARNAVFVLLVAPSGIPALILAISWSLLLNPNNGLINTLLRLPFGAEGPGPLDVYSLPWMILVQGMSLVPMTFLLITASLRGVNASLEEAARASGSGFSTIVRRITLPLLRPALIGALIYQFVTVVTALDVPLVLGLSGGVSVLSTEIYVASNPVGGLPNYGVSGTYGMFLLAVSLIPLLFYNRIIGRSQDYATITGKTFRPKTIALKRWKIPAVLFCWGYIALSFVLPMLVLLWASFQPYLGVWGLDALDRLTTAGYGEALGGAQFLDALRNTFVLGVAAALGGMVLAMALSWVIVRSRSRYRALVDILAFVPHALPGVVIGLSTLVLYLILPIPIYGTIWIIVVAMATQYISLGTRLTTAGIAQIQVGLEEAAETSGAGGRQIWQRVLGPLLRPVFLNGFLMIFLASIQNLTLPLMLGSNDNVVLSTLIWRRWDYGDVTGAAVLSVTMATITVIAATLLRRTTGTRGL
ncbi:iron ABC transporter permease [Jiangella ureilytica]|uniref:Iron ABC transporter permease n=2 Tax=Jiangella ureilytica TaxID=2530374 RepID=A0A4R4RDE5_9ACTN|nr:iron ABC transporter permease [Jiangella ureilytica]